MSLARWLLLAMLVSVSLVALAMVMDEAREFEGAVQTLRAEQAALAMVVAADFESRLERYEETGSVPSVLAQPDLRRLLGGAMKLDQAGDRVLMIAPPKDDRRLLMSNGRLVTSPELRRALSSRMSSAVLAREAAARLGLPPRIAIAGISHVQGKTGSWGVIILVSGERLRTRERHAQLRFLLGLGAATTLVGGFGGLALRLQRRQLEVARELEIAALQQDRERLLAHADKMATLAALSSGIAHEIATPLGTITARVEQVAPAVADQPKATAALRIVQEQVQRIQGVIRGLLAIARREPPAFVPSRPDEIARAAVGLVKHRFDEASIKLQLEAAPDLPAIACDPRMLEHALANLLLNGKDANPRGGRVLVLVQTTGDKVSFVVEDEGEGISHQIAERAKEPFFTTKPHGRGSGLGLAIAHEIVAQHGGELLLERRESARGTRATIRLPRA